MVYSSFIVVLCRVKNHYIRTRPGEIFPKSSMLLLLQRFPARQIIFRPGENVKIKFIHLPQKSDMKNKKSKCKNNTMDSNRGFKISVSTLHFRSFRVLCVGCSKVMDEGDASKKVLSRINSGFAPKRISCNECRDKKESKDKIVQYKAQAKESRQKLFDIIESDKLAHRCSTCTNECNPRYHKIWNRRKQTFVYKNSLGNKIDIYKMDCEIVCLRELGIKNTM